MTAERITIDQYGLDEIVLNGVDIHVERMDADHVWIGIYRHGQTNHHRLAVSLVVRNGKLLCSIDDNELGVATTVKAPS